MGCVGDTDPIDLASLLLKSKPPLLETLRHWLLQEGRGAGSGNASIVMVGVALNG